MEVRRTIDPLGHLITICFDRETKLTSGIAMLRVNDERTVESVVCARNRAIPPFVLKAKPQHAALI